MGSLTSRPKVPSVQQPQIVYVPAPVTQAPVATVPQNTGNDNSAGSGSDGQTTQEQAAAREQNLLTASRGRLGTVTTSFRGLLGLANTSGQRKTLLGE